jgi:hypothetical protein
MKRVVDTNLADAVLVGQFHTTLQGIKRHGLAEL